MDEGHLEQVLNQFHENKLAHAFLIESNRQELTFKNIKELVKRIVCENEYNPNCQICPICHLIDLDNLPSFVVIKPDGSVIKKEQILELKRKFSTRPIYTNYNIYVILNAEKLNSSSANTMLKFLEEPEDQILGFFVTNNRESVIDTIKSRCQVVTDFYEVKEVSIESTDKLKEMAIDYIKEIHLSNEMGIFYNKNKIITEMIEKNDIQNLFLEIFNIYYDFYLYSLNVKDFDNTYEELKFLQKNTTAFFLKRIKLTETLMNELNSNVNNNLLFDRFVLEVR